MPVESDEVADIAVVVLEPQQVLHPAHRSTQRQVQPKKYGGADGYGYCRLDESLPLLSTVYGDSQHNAEQDRSDCAEESVLLRTGGQTNRRPGAKGPQPAGPTAAGEPVPRGH